MKDQAKMMMSMGQQPAPVMSQPPQQVMNSQNTPMFMNQLMMNQSQSQGMVQSQGMLSHRGGGGGGYGMWPPPQVDQLKFQNPNMKHSGFVSNSSKAMPPRNNKIWKGKKGNDKWNNNNRKELPPITGGSGVSGGVTSGGGGYKPPTLKELQQQNRLKARRYFSKKKFNHGGRSAPFAPRNTTSFLIRAKKSGGITSLVSPCPVTPAVLPTPIFSPSREVLVDMAKEEWGVDGYGSMKGLIRLRSPGNDAEDEDEEDGGSSESDVEEHVEVERRLDHDLSRFEMIYPNADHSSYLLENRVDDQDTHIAQLEEENLILKERLFLMEREFEELRMRLQCLERRSRGAEGCNEEVVENDSENESESRGYGRSLEENNEVMEENNEVNNGDAELKESNAIETSVQAMEVGSTVEAEAEGGIDVRNEGLKVSVGDVHMEEHIQENENNLNMGSNELDRNNINMAKENEGSNINFDSKENGGSNTNMESKDEKTDVTIDAKEGNDNSVEDVLDKKIVVSCDEEAKDAGKEDGVGLSKDEVIAMDGFNQEVARSDN